MRNIHMIGIGGIGMSAIAQILIQKKERVSGCDAKLNSLTKKLEDLGAVIHEGHDPKHIDGPLDLVIHSSAIKDDSPELEKAKKQGIRVLKRAQMLGEIINEKKVIAVTGTHGKTTTAFMITHIMNYAGLHPGFTIGGEVDKLGGNASLGMGDYFVTEADESDGTQVYIKPHIAVITNIDSDHMEYYSDISQIASVMREFAGKMPKDGLLMGCGDDTEVNKILEQFKPSSLSYGFDTKNDIYAGSIKIDAHSSKFDLWYNWTRMGMVNLGIPGKHNILNALAATGVCMQLGIPFSKVVTALKTYPGAKRRLEIVFQNDDFTVLDDYAHHPTEISAVIDTVKRMSHKRTIGVFQPHRYTRTKFLYKLFGNCFAGLDKLIITDIYPAGEPQIENITGKFIYEEVIKFGKPDVVYIKSMDDIPGYLSSILQPGDTIIFMGAGDITELAHNFKDVILQPAGV